MRIKGLNHTGNVDYAAILKKGGAKPERGVGKNLDYFRFVWASHWQARVVSVSHERYSYYVELCQALSKTPAKLDLSANYTLPDLLTAIYGNEPDKLTVQFDTNDSSIAFDASMTRFGGNNAMLWKCDGENILLHWQNGGYSNKPIPCKAPEGVLRSCKEANGCDYNGKLQFSIPEFSILAGVQATFALYTKSPNEISAFSDLLDSYSQTGKLSATPFELYRYEQTFTRSIGNSNAPAKQKQSMVGLQPFALRESMPQLANNAIPQLAAPAPEIVEADEIELIEPEYIEADEQDYIAPEVIEQEANSYFAGVDATLQAWLPRYPDLFSLLYANLINQDMQNNPDSFADPDMLKANAQEQVDKTKKSFALAKDIDDWKARFKQRLLDIVVSLNIEIASLEFTHKYTEKSSYISVIGTPWQEFILWTVEDLAKAGYAVEEIRQNRKQDEPLTVTGHMLKSKHKHLGTPALLFTLEQKTNEQTGEISYTVSPVRNEELAT